jgi:ATP-dependent DNA helicase RecG
VSGEIQILVSTTVIEVGVDNPNASLMIIENADRFGLSQLHQLRGRIGRGSYRSVCILKSDKMEELAQKRLMTLCSTTDGFVIAEKDLELRGPGDFFGTRQHGIPALRIANLYRDTDVLVRVGHALDSIFAQDPYLENPSSEIIRLCFQQRFGSETDHPSL